VGRSRIGWLRIDPRQRLPVSKDPGPVKFAVERNIDRPFRRSNTNREISTTN
jgi:hypothetical protein